jgi:hypothetical protein
VHQLGNNVTGMIGWDDRKHIARVVAFVNPDTRYFMVLRCLVWIETTSSRQSQIELAGQQVDDGLEVSG